MTSNDSIHPEPVMEKMCRYCKEVKPLSNFSLVSKRSKDGHNTICRRCSNLKAKEHYQRNGNAYGRRYHPPTPNESGVKTCPSCNEVKDYSQFSLDRTRKDGYKRTCKQCSKVPYRYIPGRHQSTWASAARYLKTSAKQAKKLYEEAFVVQDGRCAICGKVETRVQNEKIRRLSLDHCHVTGEFRGLLCANCNMGLGAFGDNPKSLQNAIAYLQKHQQEA